MYVRSQGSFPVEMDTVVVGAGEGAGEGASEAMAVGGEESLRTGHQGRAVRKVLVAVQAADRGGSWVVGVVPVGWLG